MTVTFLVNGDASSAMGDRTRAFAARLSAEWRPVIAYRAAGRGLAMGAFHTSLRSSAPDIVYVMDMAVAGVVAAAYWRLTHRVPIVIDTGDAITALARSSGVRGPVGIAATAALERGAFRLADHVVVRGSFHRDLLASQALDSTLVPDGVDLSRFAPVDGLATKAMLGLGGRVVVGVLGSCTWSPRLRIAYGWDLVEALAQLRDLPVSGLLIGDGSGVSHLRERARTLGVADRLVVAGRRPMDELPALLAACDICLSTQTNDVVGNVRTTGKLPLYLACGRFVLASQVGEAAFVLPAEMLVPYEGVVDLEYPNRLAERIRQIVTSGRSHAAEDCVAIARRHFDYDVLGPRVEAMLTRLAVETRSADARMRA